LLLIDLDLINHHLIKIENFFNYKLHLIIVNCPPLINLVATKKIRNSKKSMNLHWSLTLFYIKKPNVNTRLVLVWHFIRIKNACQAFFIFFLFLI